MTSSSHLKYFIIIGMIIAYISSSKLKSSLTEEKANEIAAKFRPVYYFNSAEKYFPSSIEWFNINWKNATFGDDEARINYTYKGPEKLLNDAPIYVSVLENEDETLRISYAALYAFNGCGPYFHLVGQIFGKGINDKIELCPSLVHWGDIERVTITLNKKYEKILSLEYSYHDTSRILPLTK